MNLRGKNTFMYVVLFSIIAILLYSRMFRSSGYTLSPSGISINTKGDDDFQGMMKLPYKIECVPGPQAGASPYTKSLTPGGSCGIQEFVKARADYQITGGIGESLLD